MQRTYVVASSCSFATFKPGRGTGDKGKSSLWNNERKWKDDIVFEALGTTDELSSLLGICRELIQGADLKDVDEILTRVQCCLQDLCSHVATPPDSSQKKLERTKFDENFVNYVNELINSYGEKVPPLKQFILPGGGLQAANFQYARSICRKAERRLIPLLRENQIDENALKFLNRLSDLLFVLGRYVCMKTCHNEYVYQKPMFGAGEIRWQTKKLDDK
uniref:Corrinoid adenosyltransferase MMAB n=1 Tax=Acrobeloides nanus TaxID=290746 RepID=A0A914CBB2_9BILA